MNIIAPVFASGAQTSPAIEDAVRSAMLSLNGIKAKAIAHSGPSGSGRYYRDPEIIARQEDVKALVGQGATVPELAKALNISIATAWSDVKSLNIKPRLHERATVRAAKERRPKVAAMMDAGATNKEIALHFGVSQQTIGKDIKAIKETP